MNQKIAFYIIFAYSFLTIVEADDIQVLDNFDYGGMAYGSEDLIVDYATLASDPKDDLPASFTICSSNHLKFLTSVQYFFQLCNPVYS